LKSNQDNENLKIFQYLNKVILMMTYPTKNVNGFPLQKNSAGSRNVLSVILLCMARYIVYHRRFEKSMTGWDAKSANTIFNSTFTE
jgi:hypothetical protein